MDYLVNETEITGNIIFSSDCCSFYAKGNWTDFSVIWNLKDYFKPYVSGKVILHCFDSAII